MGDLDRREDDATRKRIQELVEVAASKAARQAAWRASGAVFLAIFSLWVGATVYQNAVNKRLDRSERFACERVQLQRERTNVSEARQYLVLTNAVSNPRTPADIRDRYERLAATTTYDPPTDCPRAVAHPRSYRRPPSVPFHSLGMRYAGSVVMAAEANKPQPVPTG